MAGYYSDEYYYSDEEHYSHETMPMVLSGGSQVSPHNAQSSLARSQFNSNNSYQQTTRWNHRDKNTGSYSKATVKQEASTGLVFKERGSGRARLKDEVKQTSTFRVGNKDGYTEYQVEERVRHVSYGGSSSKQIGSGSNYNNRLSYSKKY